LRGNRVNGADRVKFSRRGFFGLLGAAAVGGALPAPPVRIEITHRKRDGWPRDERIALVYREGGHDCYIFPPPFPPYPIWQRPAHIAALAYREAGHVFYTLPLPPLVRIAS
jgi:hypothetical protein